MERHLEFRYSGNDSLLIKNYLSNYVCKRHKIQNVQVHRENSLNIIKFVLNNFNYFFYFKTKFCTYLEPFALRLFWKIILFYNFELASIPNFKFLRLNGLVPIDGVKSSDLRDTQDTVEAKI